MTTVINDLTHLDELFEYSIIPLYEYERQKRRIYCKKFKWDIVQRLWSSIDKEEYDFYAQQTLNATKFYVPLKDFGRGIYDDDDDEVSETSEISEINESETIDAGDTSENLVNNENDNELQKITDTEPDNNGIFTRTIFTKNEMGQDIKIVRKMKKTTHMVKIKKSVLERKTLSKFGICENNDPGPEKGITSFGEFINFKLVGDDSTSTVTTSSATVKNTNSAPAITCRCCQQAGHWTKDCPNQSFMTVVNDATSLMDAEFSLNSGGSGGGSNGRYVPPALRQGRSMAGSGSATNFGQSSDHVTTLCINNMDEEATEDDVRDLFGRFGRLTRVTIVKDRRTKKSFGKCYVCYAHRADAEVALSELNKYAYGNMILSVTWAKPRAN